MSLAEHIAELRRRVAWSLLALVAAAIVVFIFYRPVFSVLEHPYCSLPAAHRGQGGSGNGCHLYYFGVLEGFTVRLRVAFVVGALVSAPIWLYQFWAFIAPAMHRHERRWALWFAAASTALFAAGAAVAYFTLQHALSFLLNALGGQAHPLLGVSQYLGFLTTMLVIFGAAFEFPLVIVMLNLAGIVSADRLRRWRRMAIFLVFAFAAVATPSQDPITMCALAIPMVLLYELAVLVARWHDKRSARRQATLLGAGLSPDEATPAEELLTSPN